MKILIAEIMQETNTFCPNQTDLDFFKRGRFGEGEEILTRHAGMSTEIKGFCSVLQERQDVEIIPALSAWAVTYGKVARETFEDLASRLLRKVREAGALDGVLLALHGSMVSENVDDCEGFLLEKVRQAVGPETPIVCSLDLHTAMTRKMVDNADILVGYRTYPHVDHRQTGEKAARYLLDRIQNKRPAFKLYKKIPMICDPENTDPRYGIMRDAFAGLEKLDADPHIVSVSLFTCQPWLDVYDNAFSMVLYFDDEALRQEYALKMESILDFLWKNRSKFLLHYPTIEEFIDHVDDYVRPIMLVDSGDVTTAGGTGDSTVVLRAFICAGFARKTALIVVDPETVRKACACGVGAVGRFDVGGSEDGGYNAKIRIDAEVLCIKNDEIYAQGEALKGIRIDPGKRVLLRWNGCIDIIVCEYSSFFHDPELLRNVGIIPQEKDIIVQKTHKLYIPAYTPIMKSIAIVDTDGVTARNFAKMPFKRIRRPIFPLDDLQEYSFME